MQLNKFLGGLALLCTTVGNGILLLEGLPLRHKIICVVLNGLGVALAAAVNPQKQELPPERAAIMAELHRLYPADSELRALLERGK